MSIALSAEMLTGIGRRAEPPAARIRANIVQNESGCWIWQKRVEWNGYTQIRIRGHKYATRRVSYALWNGPIPADMTVDHACHNQDADCIGGKDCLHRRCVNPAHLVLATSAANTHASRNTPSAINSRKTHCSKGHPFDSTNTYVDARGARHCQTCRTDRTRAAHSARQGRPVVPRSKTHCPRGHLFDEENTRWRPNGNRACRTCQRVREQRRRSQDKTMSAPAAERAEVGA
jgi:hypothetical protein